MTALTDKLREMDTGAVGSYLAEVDDCLMYSYKHHPMYVRGLEYLRKKVREEYHRRKDAK